MNTVEMLKKFSCFFKKTSHPVDDFRVVAYEYKGVTSIRFSLWCYDIDHSYEWPVSDEEGFDDNDCPAMVVSACLDIKERLSDYLINA